MYKHKMTREEADKVAHNLVHKEGRMIESCFVMGIVATAPEEVSDAQMNLMRFAYFSGAKVMHSLLTAPDSKRTFDMDNLILGLEEEMAAYFSWAKKHRETVIKTLKAAKKGR
jgi:hypothetical protein